jgi:hypothetical protein
MSLAEDGVPLFLYWMKYSNNAGSSNMATTVSLKKKKELRDFSPQGNYTDRATAACRRS